MTEEEKDTLSTQPKEGGGGEPETEDLGAAGKSLADALRVSFVILKIIMIVLVIAVVGSGFQTIGPDEQGIVLRFGKVQIVDSEGGVVLGPGLKWVFPFPIDELVKIPVERRVSLPINSFWYFQTPSEVLGQGPRSRPPGPKLNPANDGYALTRGERRVAGQEGLEAQGDDYNIVHSRWQVVYKVDDAYRFFKNVFVTDPKPGDVYADLMQDSVKDLLKSCFEDAVVRALVHYTIDEAIESKGAIPNDVKRRVQEQLKEIESGISVVDVTLTEMHWPRQIDDAFRAFIEASQDAKTKVIDAEALAQTLLNECAGPVAREMVKRLRQGSLEEGHLDPYWEQLAGTAQSIIAEARAYQTTVVESARSSADVFLQLLPEYRQRRELVISTLYQEAMREIMANFDEKILLAPGAGSRDNQIRILLNRDPTLKIKRNRNEETAPN